MSKSIYEVALDIVDEALYETDNSVIFKHTALNELKKALKQAQKQEKLLKLYKELVNARDDEYYDMRKLKTYLKQQIEELESE